MGLWHFVNEARTVETAAAPVFLCLGVAATHAHLQVLLHLVHLSALYVWDVHNDEQELREVARPRGVHEPHPAKGLSRLVDVIALVSAQRFSLGAISAPCTLA